MKTLIKILMVISILAIECTQILAQVNAIDFSKLINGKSYKVMLKNKWDTEGILLRKDSVSIQIRNNISTYTINKTDIWQLVDSDSEFMSESEMQLSTKPDSMLKIVELTDGSELIGYITDEDTLAVRFKTQSGTELEIRKSQISSIEIKNPDYHIGTDPNQSRLFFAPTGKTLPAGTGYFSVCELLFPMIAVGVTDFITLAGGISIVPGVDEQLYYLNGKVRAVKVKDFDFSGGILYTNFTGNDEDGLTELYVVGTYGTNENAITLGGGLSFTQNSNETYPIFIIGGEAKLSRSVKLISENWIPTDRNTAKFFSLGLRFFGKHLAGDFGLILPVDPDSGTMSGWPFIPWIGLNYNFGM